jgi:hypothetical protein
MTIRISKIFGPISVLAITGIPIAASALGLCSHDTLEGSSFQQRSAFIQENLPLNSQWICTTESEEGETIYIVHDKNNNSYLGYTINQNGQLCLDLESAFIDATNINDGSPPPFAQNCISLTM